MTSMVGSTGVTYVRTLYTVGFPLFFCVDCMEIVGSEGEYWKGGDCRVISPWPPSRARGVTVSTGMFPGKKEKKLIDEK